jgi:hypothetical protein
VVFPNIKCMLWSLKLWAALGIALVVSGLCVIVVRFALTVGGASNSS